MNFFSVSSDGRITQWTIVKVNKRFEFWGSTKNDFPQYSPGGIDCLVGVIFAPVARVQLFQFTLYLKEIAVSFN